MDTDPVVGKIAVTDQNTLFEGPLGAIEVLPAGASGGQFSVVRHPLAPRTLGSPLHTHHDEDEYSIVTVGAIGVQVGEATSLAQVGDVVCKPRGIRHAFWNPTDEPAELLEIITPSGFVEYFRELGQILAATGSLPDLGEMSALAERYRLDVDFSSVEALAREHGLRVGP